MGALFAVAEAGTGPARRSACGDIAPCGIIDGDIARIAAMIDVAPGFRKSLIVEGRFDREVLIGEPKIIEALCRMRRKGPLDGTIGQGPSDIRIIVEMTITYKRCLRGRARRECRYAQAKSNHPRQEFHDAPPRLMNQTTRRS
jgi:hypothetical protein